MKVRLSKLREHRDRELYDEMDDMVVVRRWSFCEVWTVIIIVRGTQTGTS